MNWQELTESTLKSKNLKLLRWLGDLVGVSSCTLGAKFLCAIEVMLVSIQSALF